MKKNNAWALFAVLYIAVGAAIIWGMTALFRFCSAFRGLFYDKMSMPAGLAENEAEIPPELIAENVRQVTENAARLSFSVLVFILLLQIFAFLTALIVFRRLARSQDPAAIRLKKLENADLFLDLSDRLHYPWFRADYHRSSSGRPSDPDWRTDRTQGRNGGW